MGTEVLKPQRERHRTNNKQNQNLLYNIINVKGSKYLQLSHTHTYAILVKVLAYRKRSNLSDEHQANRDD